jgi:4-amino-4-deoxy-L-arabinose transferase-like glycosyltransferase
MKKILSKFEKQHVVLSIVFLVTFLLRFPSLFEPFWYGDEGIFAAVARNLNLGGVLYQDAWDNKPPMIYLTYQAIFNIFGVSMFWLRLVTAIAVVSTTAAVYEIAEGTIGRKRAVFAASIFGFLTSLRIIEGNLALTEIFMILPISLAMMIALKRKFDTTSLFIAGVLFAIASLYKQVGALEAAALGVYLFLYNKNFMDFAKQGFVLTLGFTIPFLVTILYFAPKGLLNEYIFAAYTYYQIYLGESPQYALLVNVLKVMPVISAIGYGLYKKYKVKRVTFLNLLFLWVAFSFLGSYFSGRTYGHYLVQSVPALSLLIASIPISTFKFNRVKVMFLASFVLPILFLTRLLFSEFLSGGPINQLKYWNNFISFTFGQKTLNNYNNFFDSNVNNIMSLSDSLSIHGGRGASVYIWGDISWLYAITDAKNPSRYVTSFHVFGVPNGKEEVISDLNANLPDYIIKPKSSIGYFSELENLIASKYTNVAKIDSSEVFSLGK